MTFFEFFHFSRKFNPEEETALVKTFFEFSIFTKFYSWVCVINADGTVSEKLIPPCVVTVSQKNSTRRFLSKFYFPVWVIIETEYDSDVEYIFR